MWLLLIVVAAGEEWTSLDKARAQIAKDEAPMVVVLSNAGDEATETIKAGIAKEFRGQRVFIEIGKKPDDARQFGVFSADDAPIVAVVHPVKGEWKTIVFRKLLTDKSVLKYLRENKLTR